MASIILSGQRLINNQHHVPVTKHDPDFEALIDVLMRLSQIPDGLGELVLTREDAAAIRKCGFVARAGTVWLCPPLPDDLVWSNPLLRHLSDVVDIHSRPAGWRAKRAAEAPYNTPGYTISKFEHRLYRTLIRAPGQRLRKRDLQHRNWRMRASFFNRILGGLIKRGDFTVIQEWIYPYDRITLSRMFNG